MSKFVLLTSVAILAFGIASESRADIIASGDDCAADDGKSTCHWELSSSGVLTVSGKGQMASLHNKGWEHIKVKSAIIKDGITSLGGYAFNYAPVTDIVLADTITKIGWRAINATQISKGTIIIPDSVAFIDGGSNFGNGNIVCKGSKSTEDSVSDCDKLYSLLTNAGFKGTFTYADKNVCAGFKYYWSDNRCNRVPNEKSACSASEYYYFNGEECVADNNYTRYCAENYILKENECISASNGCGVGYKDMGGFCNRVRYTPAEAAQIAKDDGNVVTITFKK